MAWVRIHDGAMTHPKVVGLSDAAFRLWVWGLSYCQQHLTDGHVTRVALPPKSKPSALLLAGLWEIDGDHYRVHDYLQWNDSKADVLKKRDALKARVTRHRERVTNASVTSGVVKSTTDQIKKDDQTSSVLEGVQGKPAPNLPPSPALVPRSSGRQSGRLFLHRWQLDELIATLGEHAADFGLDEWLDGLQNRPGVLPVNRWQWVQDELHAEVTRRHLPVAATTAAAPTNKRIAGLMAGGEAFLRRVAAAEAK